jgi:hypothetical protein
LGLEKEMQMKHVTLALALMALTFVAPLKANDNNSSLTQIPVTGVTATGDTFAGTFTLQKFVNTNGKVVAVGTIAGAMTDAGGHALGSGLQIVAVPIVVNDGATTAAAPAGVIGALAASCPVLHLELGPLSLDLLGLQVNLNRVVLDITAVPGAGNLLGNLLCSVTNLLNNPAGLANLLNQLLGILQGL